MKLLASHQNIFTWLRIFPFSAGTNRKTLRLSLALIIYFFVIEMLSLISSILFMWEHVLNSQNYSGSSLYSISQVAGHGCTIYTLIAAYILYFEINCGICLIKFKRFMMVCILYEKLINKFQ